MVRHRFGSFRQFIMSHEGCHDSWQMAQAILVKGTALVYFMAFLSLLFQVQGLYGSEGILPVNSFMSQIEQLDFSLWQLPTIFWLSQENWFLDIICVIALVSATAAIIGFQPLLALAICWFCYLSFCLVGQDFIPFQWDTLLCEIGFLVIFLCPSPRLGVGFSQEKASFIIIWLLRILLFKLMFSSGVVKLASDDPAWSAFTALEFHYESQPLPNPGAWLLHQLPSWFHFLSVSFTFMVELVLPFAIFLGRRPRYFAFAWFFLLQVFILVSGNYGFFNLLTIVLLFCLVDDGVFQKFFPKITNRAMVISRLGSLGLLWIRRLLLVIVPLLYGTHFIIIPLFKPAQDSILGRLHSIPKKMMIFNNYGLFAVMTTGRPEMIIEGSADGKIWKPYNFRYKIQNIDSLPPVILGHMPRLDWQMWFLQFRPCKNNRWIKALSYRLLLGSQPVIDLLKENPFIEKPPVYIRVNQYDYRFRNISYLLSEGQFWTKRLVKPYCPVMVLK